MAVTDYSLKHYYYPSVLSLLLGLLYTIVTAELHHGFLSAKLGS
jgi:hypothetical protein